MDPQRPSLAPDPLLLDLEDAQGDEMIAEMAENLGQMLAGDYNNSGAVEQADLDLVLLNWGQTATPVPTGWVGHPPDGTIDQEELDGVLLNWGSHAPPLAPSESVPEPRTLLLLLLAPTPLIFRLKW
jgi:hypothetical protein